MTTVAIDLPDEAFSALKQPPSAFVQGMRLAAAIHWYARGEISMEKAALIAGMDRADFLAALAAEQVDVFEVDVDSLRRELARG
jgi:predicted HTH domain antitoxin